jgi:hypothetical protein
MVLFTGKLPFLFHFALKNKKALNDLMIKGRGIDCNTTI